MLLHSLPRSSLEFSHCCFATHRAFRSAPYALNVAIPAMMMGHLAIAGVAEGAIAAGLVAYLQIADPALLQNTSGVGPAATGYQPVPQKSLRRLWMTIAML